MIMAPVSEMIDFLKSTHKGALSTSQMTETFDCKTLVNDALRQSLSIFLKNIDMACVSIRGMDVEQQSSSGEEMYITHSHVVDEIATVLTTVGATKEDVVDACVHIRAQHANVDISSQKRRLQTSIDGVDMLALVAASSVRVGDMIALLRTKLDVIKAVCLAPPDALIKSMKRHGLNYSVLNVVMQHSGADVEKTGSIIAQYLSTNSVASKLHNACIEALQNIHQDISCNILSTRWSNIHVEFAKKRPSESDFECTIGSPPHLPQVPQVLLKSFESDTSCTRVSRFLDALEQCARLGIFIPDSIDTRYLLKMAWDSNVPTASTWQAPPVWEIPDELKRDFCIMLAVERLLPCGKGTLYPLHVAEWAMNPGSFMQGEGCTRRSMEQAVNHVIRKCVVQIKYQTGFVSGIEYIKNPNPDYSIGHLKFDASGSARLRVHVRRLLTSMATNPTRLKTEWRASRSSRKMAARVRVTLHDKHNSYVW